MFNGNMKSGVLLALIALVASLLAYWASGSEGFAPFYCSTRSDSCLDLGVREQTAYSSP